MRTTRKVLFCLFIFAMFLSSCDKNQAGRNFSYSSINKILRMHPVKITIAEWNSPSEVGMTEQLFIEAVENPKNWIVRFETTDVNQINTIMIALAKPPVEPYSAYMLPMEYKISFEDKNSRIKWTSLNISGDYDKRVFLSDIIYGKETYNVFAKILNNIKYESLPQIQEMNAPAQKRRPDHPEKLSENTSNTYKDWYNYGILSPTSEIIKMYPVQITFTRIVVDNLPKTETKENMVEFFNDANNLEINLEITDANEINAIMTALSKPSIEEGPWWLFYESWMIITDKSGNVKRTVIATHRNTKEIFLYDRFYGAETYDVIGNFLKKEKEEHYKRLRERKNLKTQAHEANQPE